VNLGVDKFFPRFITQRIRVSLIWSFKMSYRFFIDIPLGGTQEEALKTADHFLNLILMANRADITGLGIDTINYRLGHDEDRQNRNYFQIDDAGHASTKKCKIKLKEDSNDLL
jgi:hypothetical protein